MFFPDENTPCHKAKLCSNGLSLSPSVTNEPPCLGSAHDKSGEDESPFGRRMELWRGGNQLWCRLRHLTVIQNYEICC
ncbi:hypothetical protein TNCV_501171 [Trichonephila clavipes]|nr:hypothetical protein TNCV_501171 [Trichonephila clavipes]